MSEETVSNSEELSPSEQEEYQNVLKRIDSICHKAARHKVGVFIDADGQLFRFVSCYSRAGGLSSYC